MSNPEFYPTPSWTTYAILAREPMEGSILEPACGKGDISKIVDAGQAITSRDLYDHGYGETGVDFFKDNEVFDNIITNPPYALANDWVLHGWNRINKKMILLLRLAFLEGQRRKALIYDVIPPARIWVSSKRITMYPEGKQIAGSSTTAYAWFVWDKEYKGPTTCAVI